MRGEAGKAPLERKTLYRLGRALAKTLDTADGRGAPRICIGRDTRESCGWIEAALARGVREGGGVALSAGVIPTPGLALVTREQGFDAGLMVSASHNPFHDNGVKVFNREGAKLSDEVEAAIERDMGVEPAPDGDEDALLEAQAGLHAHYLAFLERCLEGTRLDGLRVVLDAAHGAAYQVGPEAFRAAGADVVVIGDAPDGRNINEGCGSLYPEQLAERVRAERADLGFAFDGDADRCIGASSAGRILDGDFTLFFAGRALHHASRLPNATVVSTVMSNLGLEKALEREGIRMLRTKVGDRYVLEAMRAGGHALGGEQSGHVIFMEHAPTGDGVLTALTMAKLVRDGAGDIDEALDVIPRYPQLLKNVRVSSKPAIEDHPVLREAVAEAEREMAGEGRVVIRYSGTEPKARVMVEGADESQVRNLVEKVCAVFEREIGA
jgi:phosphoglucosamine mutase